jgi:hypothetical protein
VKLDAELLVNACLTFIDENCTEIMIRKEILEAELQTLEVICKRDTLHVSEIDLYEALSDWSKAECYRRSISVTVENRHKVLVTILPEVRFPIMTLKTFTEEIVPGMLLKDNQIIQLFKWFTADDQPEVDFPTRPRIGPYGQEYSVIVPLAKFKALTRLCVQSSHSVFINGYGLQEYDLDDKETIETGTKLRAKDGFYRFAFNPYNRLIAENKKYSNFEIGESGEFIQQHLSKAHKFVKEINKEITFSFRFLEYNHCKSQSTKLYFQLYNDV